MLSEKQWQPIQVVLLGCLVLLSLSGGIILSLIANHLGKSHLTANALSLLMLVIMVLTFQGGAIVWVHFFLKNQSITWGEGFGFQRGNILECVVWTVLALIVVFVGVAALGAASQVSLTWLHEQLRWNWLKPELQAPVQLLQQQKWPAHLLAVQAITTVLIAPVGEEILFRGILYTAIKQRGRPQMALWVTAALFALIHFSPVNLLSLLFLAIVLAALYEKTKNLLAPILLHSAFNGIMFMLIVTHPQWTEKLFNR
jgi:membrane protease YdiL (CAAX protease family)